MYGRLMAAPPEALLDPPAFLQLVAHPLRWELLTHLARSDRTVRELTGLSGQPQNLVSYHLAKLREAELVTARQSSADRRDAYYSVALGRVGNLLAATGQELHPGLRLNVTPAIDLPRRRRKARVLFLCTGNSARSQIAEALAKDRSGGWVDACSAGSDPKPLDPRATQVMRDDYGIDLSSHRSKHLGVFAKKRFDRVISLCDRVREVCPEFPGDPVAAHWSIPDLLGRQRSTGAALRETARELDDRIRFLLPALAASSNPGATTTKEEGS